MTYQPFSPAFRFNDTESLEMEKQTWSDMLDEGAALYGPQLKYIDVTHTQPDQIFGEHFSHTLERGVPIQLILENIEEDFYPEDGGLFSKFGYSPQLESATFYGSVNYFAFHNIVPQEDDVIYYEKVKKLFEIIKVTLLDDFKYRLDVRLYNYDHAEIAADVTDISILDIEDINDDEVIKINDMITDQVETLDIIEDPDTVGDGLFD